MNSYQLISKDELKRQIDASTYFKLVMCLGDWHFMAKHIPGSIHIDSLSRADSLRLAVEQLQPNDEIVVYCADKDCAASKMGYLLLVDNGYNNVRRFAGGIGEWEEAGYPLDGRMAG